MKEEVYPSSFPRRMARRVARLMGDEPAMTVLGWLLGVPLTVILLLWLMGVVR